MMTSRLLKFFAWSSFAAIVFVTVSPIGLRPHDPLPVNTDRALAFAVMTFFFVSAYPRKLWFLLPLLVISAGAIEAMQLLAPTRHAHLLDALVKASGVMIGAGAAVLATWIAKKWPIRSGQQARESTR
jgi:hypothetical protein